MVRNAVVPQLAVIIDAPGLDLTSIGPDTRVTSTDRDLRYSRGQPCHIDWRGVAGIVTYPADLWSRHAVSEFTLCVQPPASRATGVRHHAGVVTARRDGRDVRSEACYIDGHRAADLAGAILRSAGRSVAELAPMVVAPTLERSCVGEGAGCPIACRYLFHVRCQPLHRNRRRAARQPAGFRPSRATDPRLPLTVPASISPRRLQSARKCRRGWRRSA